MYIAGPLIGGAIAGFVHWIHADVHEKEKEEKEVNENQRLINNQPSY